MGNCSFRLNGIFLKLADKLEMDKISDECENGLDRIINQSHVPLIHEKPLFDYHQHNSFSFDRIFQKLADKMDMEEISVEFKTWPDRIISLRVTSP